MITKNEARVIAKANLNSLSEQEKLKRSKIIINKIINLQVFKEAKNVALYYPLSNEANLLELLKYNKVFCFPKIKADGTMDFIYINKKTLWIKNKFGIKEPKSGKIVSEGIDLMLIPSLAKNNEYERLGFGQGYYDKFLANNQVSVKIGILLNNTVLNFKKDYFDISLNMFITSEE